METKLCPTQQAAFDTLIKRFSFGSVFELQGNVGVGKSTVLQVLHEKLGGVFLQSKDFLEAMQGQHPLALEETFERLMMGAIRCNTTVIVDDLHLLLQIMQAHAYPRSGLLHLPLLKLFTYATETQKQLIIATNYGCYGIGVLYPETVQVQIAPFAANDYSFLCQEFLKPVSSHSADLNYDKIYRFASHLNAYQLRRTCLERDQDTPLTTEGFIEYLKSQQLSSNVDLGEVQPVDLSSLKGVDDVLQSLEANLIIPLEQDELAKELNLKPKRGVLLAGPPGTGKTTIGRALAHRLKSKFFLIDGTFISGTGDFYHKIHYIFEAAKENAPAIVFIDDTDVIFEDGGETGLYRYLLTLLDGLESETAGQVCVMMTAMDVHNLPPALVRSGRIELWLEMRLPNDQARTEILQSYLEQLAPVLRDVDIAQVVAATADFTGADLKRLIEEVKTLYAYDRVQGQALKSPTEYFLAAVELVLANKHRYAEAESAAQQAVLQRHRTGNHFASIHPALIHAMHQTEFDSFG